MRLGRWASAVCGLALIALSAASVAGNLLAVDLGSGFLKVRFLLPTLLLHRPLPHCLEPVTWCQWGKPSSDAD